MKKIWTAKTLKKSKTFYSTLVVNRSAQIHSTLDSLYSIQVSL